MKQALRFALITCLGALPILEIDTSHAAAEPFFDDAAPLAKAKSAPLALHNTAAVGRALKNNNPVKQNSTLAKQFFNRGIAFLNNEDPVSAIKCFKVSAKNGDLIAMYNLGILLVEKDRADAKEWFEQAAAKGYPAAMYNLGVLLKEESDKEGDRERAKELLEKAKKWLEQTATKGHLNAMCNLGVLLREEGDIGGAKKFLKQAADAGDLNAKHDLGDLLCEEGKIKYEEGKIKEAKEWFKEAADAGSLTAVYNLAALLRKEGDIAGAKRLLKKAADAGDLDAMYRLGVLFLEEDNIADANKFFSQAIDKGNAEAVEGFALSLAKEGDIAGAKKLFKQAAAKGFSSSMYCLGVLSQREGEIKEAEEHYRSAIAAGNTKALLKLAILLPAESLEKDSLYRKAWESGVKNADVFYAIFLFNKGRDEAAREVENFIKFDVQEEAPNNEPSAEAESEEDSEVEEDVDFSRTPLKKMYKRAKKSLKNLSISAGELGGQVIRTYKDVEVTAHKDALPEINRFKSKIRELLSCLANGEKRGKIEPLKNKADGRQQYSLRIRNGDRLIIEILNGDIIKGVKKVYTLAAAGHYNPNMKGRATRNSDEGVQIPDWNE